MTMNQATPLPQELMMIFVFTFIAKEIVLRKNDNCLRSATPNALVFEIAGCVTMIGDTEILLSK